MVTMLLRSAAVSVMLSVGLHVALGDIISHGSASISMDFVFVPGIPGGNPADPQTGRGSVEEGYRIGQFEVTAGQYTEFLNAVASAGTPNPYSLYNSNMWSNAEGCKIEDLGGGAYGVAADWADRPVNFVSWNDAARFCNWLTTGNTETGVYNTTTWTANRAYLNAQGLAYFLPTDNEWYKPAYYSGSGSTYYDHPMGSDALPSNVLGSPDPGNNATFLVSPNYTIGAPYYRTEVGEHENSESPYLTYDQGGNVFEWTETNLGGGIRRVLGGGYLSGQIALRADQVNQGAQTSEFRDFGFRVASVWVPEPSAFGMLMVGLGGLVARRRRRGCC